MDNLKRLINTHWFMPVVVILALTDMTIGLVIGLKIGYAKGQQSVQMEQGR